MRRHLLTFAACAALVAPAMAQQTVTTYVDANGNRVAVSPANPLPVTGSSGGGTSGNVAQGSTTAGQTGPLVQCTAVTGNQSYTIGSTNPLNCVNNGRLKVAVSNAGNVDPATQLATTLTADLVGCKSYSTRATWGDQFTGSIQCDIQGNLYVNNATLPPGAATSTAQTTGNTSLSTLAGTVAANGSPATNAQTVQASALPLPTGAATSANQPAVATAGSAAPTTGTVVMGSDGSTARALSLSSDGRVILSASSAALGVNGTVANAATDAGNPVKVGGVYRATRPTYTDGQRADLQVSSRGDVYVNLSDGSGNSISYDLGNADAATTSRYGPWVNAYNRVFNGSTWDRVRGDTIGSYVVPKGPANLATAQVSIGTAATLVAAARAGRSRLTITQSAAGPCYYGPTNTVSATTGARLTVAGASKTYQYAGALYGICPGGAVTTDTDEEY